MVGFPEEPDLTVTLRSTKLLPEVTLFGGLGLGRVEVAPILLRYWSLDHNFAMVIIPQWVRDLSTKADITYFMPIHMMQQS